MNTAINFVNRRPVSIDGGKTIWTCGSSRSMTNRLATSDADRRLHDVFGCLNGVLGGNELLGRYLLIDYPNRQIACGDELMSLEGAKSVPLETDRQGRPFVTVTTGGSEEPNRLLLDTGTGVTFRLSNFCPEEHMGDYSGSCPPYREPDYVAERIEDVYARPEDFSFEGVTFNVEVGYAGQERLKSLRQLLGEESLDGVIGYDFFMNFSVLIDRKAGVLYYRHNENRRRFHYFFELHAPYYDVYAKSVKVGAVHEYLNAELPSGFLDEDESEDGEHVDGKFDLERGTLKVMEEGGAVAFEHDLQPVGDRAFVNFSKYYQGSINDMRPGAEDERIVFTVCEAKCDGAGTELWTDDPFDPSKIRFSYEQFTDCEGIKHSLMDRCGMSYDGRILDFEDLSGPYDENVSRFA